MLNKVKGFFQIIKWNCKMYGVYIRHAKFACIFSVICSIVQGISPAVNAWGIASIASVLMKNNFDFTLEVGFFAGIVAFANVSNSIMYSIKNYLGARVAYKVEYDMRREFNDLVGKFDLRFRETTEYWDIAGIANVSMNLWNIRRSIDIFPQAIANFLTIISSTVILFAINPLLPFFNIVVLIFMSYRLSKENKNINKYYLQNSLEIRQVNTLGDMTFSDVASAEMKIFNGFTWAKSKWSKAYDSHRYKLNIHLGKKYAINNLIGAIQGSLNFLTVLLYMLLTKITAVEVILVIVNCNAMASAITNFSNSIDFISESSERFKNYFKLHNINVPPTRAEGDSASGVSISMKNISFIYKDGAKPDEPGFTAIKNLNLNINKYETVAIVGENGSGKSTLANIILQIYIPTSGEIKFNDKDTCYRTTCVLQDFGRYMFSPRENVSFGEIALLNNDEQIWDAIDKSDIRGVIEEIGLDGQLGKEFGGRDFSGGEWQRLALARGFIRNKAALVVFDEPNSAIDPIAEAKVIQNMLDVGKNKTCIFISHRLSSVRMADRIIVMKDGCVVEDGCHSKLMLKKGEYYRMFTHQAELYKT